VKNRKTMKRCEPTHLLYRAATGQVVPAGDATCSLCGSKHERSAKMTDVIRDTFTNHGMCRVPSSDDACQACEYYFNHRWDTGQQYPMEYRKRSLVVTEGEVIEWMRADMKVDIEKWLHEGCPHGVFLVSLSKKKHCLPLAVVNPPGRSFVVQVEEDRAMIDESYWPLCSAFSCLISLGAKKGEILSGEYHHATLKQLPSSTNADGLHASVATVLKLDKLIAPHRPSPLLTLISYLIIVEEKK